MKKGKKTLLPKTMAAVLSMALVVGALWNAAPVNVLAAELAAPVDNVIGEPETDEEPVPGENLPEETTPEEAPQGGTVPEKIALEGAAPQETVPEAGAPVEANPAQTETFNAERSTAEGDTYSYTVSFTVVGDKTGTEYAFENLAVVKAKCGDGSELEGSYVMEEGTHKYTFELEKGKMYSIDINNMITDTVGTAGAPDHAETVYAVNFYDGDALYEVRYKLEGMRMLYSQPEAPEKPGYTFTGWVTENGGSQEFDFYSKITAETNIYASWTKDSSDDENKGWTLGEDGTLTILSQAGMDDWEANKADKVSQVVKVIVQGDVTEIQDNQFNPKCGNSYPNLKEIDLGGSQITKIGVSAFQDANLQSVVLCSCEIKK